MDALSVVLQLKRIATDQNVAADILLKIPRLAVGLSYFLEHPDSSVQYEAVKALLVACEIHRNLIINSLECNELKVNINIHCNSSDNFLKDICQKLLEILDNNFNVIINTEPNISEENTCNKDNTECIIQPVSSSVLSSPLIKSDDDIPVLKGDLYTLILALQELEEEDKTGWTSTENFINNLKQKTLCIPGIVSVSINMKKRKNLSANKKKKEKLNNNGSEELDKQSDSDDILNDSNNEYKENEDVSIEEDIIKELTMNVEITAIVLIRLPIDKTERAHIFKMIKVRYFVLKIESMEEKRKADKFVLDQNIDEEARKISESTHTDLDEDFVFSVDDINVNVPASNQILQYIDEIEEEKPDSNESLLNNSLSDENGSKPARWSFFGNPLIFSESRHIGRGAIIRSGEDPELIDKLQRKKEELQQEKQNKTVTKKTNTLDKILGEITRVKFW